MCTETSITGTSTKQHHGVTQEIKAKCSSFQNTAATSQPASLLTKSQGTMPAQRHPCHKEKGKVPVVTVPRPGPLPFVPTFLGAALGVSALFST